MKYSYSWLKELSGTKKSLEKIADDLTMRSMEVEKLEKPNGIPKGVVVGKILEIKKHPNADKLQVVKVSTSPQPSPLKGEGVLDIVCGANNIKVGDLVPLATIGTKLPKFEIKEAVIRGEKSFGMLCAADELGFGEDHSGIMILDKKAKIGESLEKYLGAKDAVIEIKVLPDRAHDALSHVGVAREIAILENKKLDYDFDGLKLPKIKSKKARTSSGLSVKIEDKKLCSRYIGAVMANIKIQESPQWMKERLKTCEVKAINNVVDATNYVMLELGNPLHAFDAEEIKNSNIIVRKAKKGEKLILLDDSRVELAENDLLITSGEMPLALAGIMGGKNSGISENTKTIVLEAANFDAVGIRRTRSRLGIRSESSDRFEKGIDPNLAEKAMARVIEILEHTAGAKLEKIVDVYPQKIKPAKIKLDLNYANNLLGEKISGQNIVKILKSLDIKVKASKKIINCVIPTFRLDLKTQEDLIEEIGRVWGYEKIKVQPLFENVLPARKNEQIFFERKIQEILISLGFDEAYNYSFYGEKDLKNFSLNEADHFELENPMNPEQKYIRTNLLPNALKNVQENIKHFREFGLFEIGRSYLKKNGKPLEKRELVMANVLESQNSAGAFFEIKGAVEHLLTRMGVKKEPFSIEESLNADFGNIWNKSRVLPISVKGNVIGYIGEISPLVMAKYKLKKRVAMAEIDLEAFRKSISELRKYSPISKFPSVFRDISLVEKSGKTAAQISAAIKTSGGEFLQNVELFDVYEKERSYAFHLEFNAENRTLESAEIEKLMEKIIFHLEKELGAEIRK